MMIQLTNIVVLLVAVGLASSQRFTPCRPGEVWKEECNRCTCTREGIPICTTYSCPPDAYHNTKRLGDCKPYSRWRVDCNYCECTEFGDISCTNNICSENDLASNIFKREVKKCKPGDKWKDDCNDCVCTHTGYPSCTLKACASQTYIIPNKKTKREAPEDPVHRAAREVKTCTPGSSWKEDCNNCHCSEDGKAACTLKACPPQTEYLQIKTKRSAEACKPGSSWQEECNHCFCDQKGEAACTLKACPSQTQYFQIKQRRAAEPAASLCKPGSTWKEDCNNCFCDLKGRSACTLKACVSNNGDFGIKDETPDTGEALYTCVPGSTWKQECNLCHCGPNGKAACTLKACLSETSAFYPITTQPPHQGRPSACQPGSSWKEDCNDCFCDDQGRSACTLKACLSKSATLVQACKPGDQWKVGCNTCTCTKDGNAACTKKACLPEEQNSRRKRETCKPGDQWKVACNTCTCTKDGNAACTRKACLPEEKYLRRKRETACNPGETWKQECNSCFCAEDGKAACTRRLCEPEETSSRRKRAGKCSPGEKWNEGCNNCYCSKDGNPLCTRRLCRRRRDTECRPPMKLCGSPTESEPKSKKRGGKLRGRGRCTPGSTWEQNCSSCFCDQQGNVDCVANRPCQEEPETARTREGEGALKGRGRCEPGSTWQLVCNTCSCDQNGNIVCTDDPCDSMEVKEVEGGETRSKRATGTKGKRWCKPGDFMYFNCDKCPCGVMGITGCNSRTCKER